MEVLQTSALPLGDGADQNVSRRILSRVADLKVRATYLMRPKGLVRRAKSWSGKRDSNPRLRPWQGRTLPLSYSRSPVAASKSTKRKHIRATAGLKPATS